MPNQNRRFLRTLVVVLLKVLLFIWTPAPSVEPPHVTINITINV